MYEWINGKKINLVDIYSKGSWELDKTLWEKKLIQNVYNKFKNTEDFFFLDIGCNFGSYSFVCKEITGSKCYSFDPIKRICDVLQKNIELHNLEDRIKVFNLGLSDTICEKEMKIPLEKRIGSGLSSICDKPLRFNKFSTEKVKITTIDKVLESENIEKIDFIKIDTEGWEYYILKGGLETIKKYKPIIQIELWEQNLKQSNVTKKDLYKLLDDMNYFYKFISHEDLWCEYKY